MKKLFLLAIISSLLCVGCGASSSMSSTESSVNSMSSNLLADSISSYDTSEAYDVGSSSYEESHIDSESEVNQDILEEKLITTISIQMETRTFEETLEIITSKTEATSGYIASIYTSGDSYHSYSGYTRSADLILKIPSDKVETLLSEIEGTGNIVSRSETTENVTLQYTDMESRINTLNAEYDRLMELMESAESVEDIITIETRLSDVIYEKESYESQLKILDNRIDYTEISITLNEVERETVVENQGFFQESFSKMKENIEDIGKGLRELGINLIAGIPYFVLLFMAVGAVVIIAKTITKKSKTRKNEKNDGMSNSKP